jgi:cytoskeletal protein CcmA (bactofilin family)
MTKIDKVATVPAPGFEESRLGKSILIKGQISGSEPIFVGGRIQGSISIPGARLTIGKEAQVAANIAAREVMVLGSLLGNLNVSDRVHVHGEGSCVGDIIAQRLSVDDGALLKGNVELQASHGSTADAKAASQHAG